MTFRGVEIYLTKTGSSTKFRVLMANDVLRWFQSRNAPTGSFEGRVNGFTLTRGKDISRGHVLLSREDMLAIQSSDFDITLTFAHRYSADASDVTVSIEKLGITYAEALTGHTGAYNTDGIIYLVELSDVRYIAHHAALDAAYNVVHPDRTSLYIETLNGGSSQWTWLQMIQDIWDTLPSAFGTLSTTYYDAPTTTPVNYNFQGVRSWDALNAILDDIHHVLLRGYDGTFYLYPDYGEDTAFDTRYSTAASRLVDVSSNLINICEAPENVKVFFPSSDDAFQLSTDPLEHHPRDYWKNRVAYSVTVATASYLPSGFTPLSGTVGVLHDSLPAIYNELGVLQNSSALSSRAAELAEQYVKGMTQYPVHNLYEGVITFAASPKLTSIAWYDMGDGVFTEIMFSPRRSGGGGYQPSPHALSYPAGDQLSLITAESPGPADIARTHPEYEMLVLVDLVGDLAANSRAVGRVQFGTNAAASITWADTGLPHEIYVYEAHGNEYDAGTRLWVKFQQQVRRWVVIPVGGGGVVATVNIKRFKLTAPLSLGGYSTAIEIGTSAAFTETGTEFPIKDPWENPGAWRYDPGTPGPDDGYMGWCILPDDPELNEESDPYWEIIWMEQIAEYINFTVIDRDPLIQNSYYVELDSFFGNGGRYKDPSESDLYNVAGSSIDVVDVNNNFPYAMAGCKGLAVYNGMLHQYEIVQCNQQAVWAVANLDEDMCIYPHHSIHPGPSYTIKYFTAIHFPPYGKTPDPEPIEAFNYFNLEGFKDSTVLLTFDATERAWVVVQILHQELDVLVNIKINQDGNSIDGVFQKIAAMYCRPRYEKRLIDLTDCDEDPELFIPERGEYTITGNEANFSTGGGSITVTAGRAHISVIGGTIL